MIIVFGKTSLFQSSSHYFGFICQGLIKISCRELRSVSMYLLVSIYLYLCIYILYIYIYIYIYIQSWKQCTLPVITAVALWQLLGTWCAKVHELPQSHCGDNWEGTLFSWLYIYFMLISHLWDLRALFVVDHLWPVIYIIYILYIYPYLYLYISISIYLYIYIYIHKYIYTCIYIYMLSWQQFAFPVITTMALWQLMHLGTYIYIYKI